MEPAEEPATATWEEARGPHLPDRVTAVPVMVWPFVALTVVVVYVRSRLYAGVPFDASILSAAGLGIAQLAAMTLLGAALFLRHPDAWSRLRPVAIAVTLLAVSEALNVLRPTIGRFVVGDPTGDEPTQFTASYVIGLVATIIGVLGIASLAYGLRATRRSPDATRTVVLFIVLSVGALAVLAAGYGRVLDDQWFGGAQAIEAAAARISIALHAIGLLAWVAVASVLIIGARGRERPIAGWLVGAVATLAIAFGLEPIYYLWLPVDQPASGITLAGWISLASAATGAVLLLIALGLGLPEPSEGGHPPP